MIVVAKVIRLIFKSLRCLGFKSRFAFSLVVSFSIISPVFDLALFKLLASLFSANSEMFLPAMWILALVVFLLVVTNILKYYAKIKKIAYVNRLVEYVYVKSLDELRGSINWFRMAVLEIMNIIISSFHVIILSCVSMIINLEIGLMLVCVSIVSFVVLNYFFSREVYNQKTIRYNRNLLAVERGESNVTSRIKSSEQASIVINSIVLVFFIVLVYLGIQGDVNSHDGLIFLFITKFISSNYGNLASSLMRLARAWSNIFDKYDNLHNLLSQ